MSNGSGLFSKQHAAIAHLLGTSGLAGEVADLRRDVLEEMTPLLAITIDEFTNLVATDTAGLHVAAATTVAPATLTTFVAGGVAALAAQPRSIKFTTAGVTASDAPATCVVTGKDINGDTQTETVTLAQTATTAETAKCYKSLTSVAYAAADGTGATIAIGVGTKIGLSKKLKARAGVSSLLREIIGGAVAAVPADVAVDEWTDAVAASANGLHAATATTVAVQTLLTAALSAGGVAALLAYPRNVTFTTAGVTAADAPANAVITGTDIDGQPLTETVTLAQTATIASGVKAFKTITSIVYAAGDGTGATIAVGFGQVFGLSKTVKFRAGTLKPLQEIAVGAVVTTGTLANATTSPPHGSYSPSTAPDGANDYAVYYETANSAGSTLTNAATSAPNGCYVPSLAPDGARDYALVYEYDPTVA